MAVPMKIDSRKKILDSPLFCTFIFKLRGINLVHILMSLFGLRQALTLQLIRAG